MTDQHTTTEPEPVHGVWGHDFTGPPDMVPRRHDNALDERLQQRDRELERYRRLHVLVTQLSRAWDTLDGETATLEVLGAAHKALFDYADALEAGLLTHLTTAEGDGGHGMGLDEVAQVASCAVTHTQIHQMSHSYRDPLPAGNDAALTHAVTDHLEREVT